jgi:hypothetical protein
MNENAPFRPAEVDIRTPEVHQPEPIPPNGEIIAWILLLIFAGASGLLLKLGRAIPLLLVVSTIGMLLMALAIRFSRWLERHSFIELKPDGIRYSSPIRKTELVWSGINKLVASRAGNGWRIFVFGEMDRFHFQTATSMQGLGGRQAVTGYAEGAEIVAQILRYADLGPPVSDGSNWEWESA